jgi:hypothetical protein
MKMAVIWVAAPYSLVALLVKAASISETSVNHKTTRRYNPEDSHIHNHRCKNLKANLKTKFIKCTVHVLQSVSSFLQKHMQAALICAQQRKLYSYCLLNYTANSSVYIQSNYKVIN